MSPSPGGDGTSMPLPGEIVYYDYRDRSHSNSNRPDRGAPKPGNEENAPSNDPPSAAATSQPRPLRLVSFNVERGYELARVVSLLKSLDPDIVALQECDWGCERSGSVDVSREIAKALKFAGAFVAEFEEIDSPARSERDAGGGLHGNAVLCRWGFAKPWGFAEIEVSGELGGAFAVPHAVCYDWERETEKAVATAVAAAAAAAAAATAAKGRFLRFLRFLGSKNNKNKTPASREPRRGRRVALGAACRVPLEKLGLDDEKTKKEGPENESKNGDGSGFAVVVAYSLHLECFCGATGRALQLRDVFGDARWKLPELSRMLELGGPSSSSSAPAPAPSSSRPPLSPPPPRPRLYCSVLGDLNTLAHGIVGLSPLRARGRARWSSLGRTEARWLHSRVLLRVEEDEEEDEEEVEKVREENGDVLLKEEDEKSRPPPPPLFFECPFPLDLVTFDNPGYHLLGGRLRLVRGKLDWALLLLNKGRRKRERRSWRGREGRKGSGGEAEGEQSNPPPPPPPFYGVLTALSAATANDDFSASDHKALVVDVVAE